MAMTTTPTITAQRAVRTIIAMPWHGFSAVSGAWMLHPSDAHLLDPVLGIDAFMLRDSPFAPHPHAGFSAVTLLFPEAEVGFHNFDSLGTRCQIAPGDLHWTQAGRGMMHDEPPIEIGPKVTGLQVFVNLAMRHKESPPVALHTDVGDMPLITLPGVQVRVVSGAHDGHIAPITSDARWLTQIAMLDATLDPGAAWQTTIPAGQRAFFVLIQGTLTVANETRTSSEEARQAFVFEDTGDAVTLQNTGNDAARGVLFYGMPLGEPIVSHGPFNGNTGADIARYIERYQRGEMGILEPDGRLVRSAAQGA